MRLIDADALPRFGSRNGLIHSSDVDAAPTVDPVRHGKWIDAQFVSPENGGKIIAKCNVCGVYTTQNRYKLNNFCAECGADMRGAE